ncbi:MAG: hypothetical protein ABJB86_01250 [Bacteroidota bacterium]
MSNSNSDELKRAANKADNKKQAFKEGTTDNSSQMNNASAKKENKKKVKK